MIDIQKYYRTRDGREVKIYSTTDGKDQLVHGAIQDGAFTFVPFTWFPDGRSDKKKESADDLIQHPRRLEREIWINVYDDSVDSHLERRIADMYQYIGKDRFACIAVQISCHEGEGLNDKMDGTFSKSGKSHRGVVKR